MKKLNRILAVVLSICLCIGILSACGGGNGKNAGADGSMATDTKETQSQNKDTGTEPVGNDQSTSVVTGDGNGQGTSGSLQELTLPLCEDKQELTVWLVYNGKEISDLNDIKGIQKMEELTNVHVNWIPIGLQEVQEKFNLLLGSGNYPDIIYPASYPYPGGIEKGIDDGVFVDAEELILNYMPNYMNCLKNNEEARKEATSDEGRLLAPRIIVSTDTSIEGEGTYSGLAYRKDILDDLGLDVPTTVNEWHDVLVKCKESGMPKPFMIQKNGSTELSLAWGVNTTSTPYYMQLDGNKVVFGPTLDGYGQYLETMRQWYSEGLIDPNFTSGSMLEKFDMSPLDSNETMLFTMISSFCADNLYKTKQIANADVFIQPIQNPVVNEGDEPIQDGRRIVAKDPLYITTSCKDPVLAAKWLDFQFSDQGMYLNWYGVEGESYVIGEDGTPQFTDLVMNNPDGLTPESTLARYALNAAGSCWLGRHNTTSAIKLKGNTDVNYQKAAVDIWSEPKNINLTESISLTSDEGSQVNPLLTAINTLVEEYAVNYIIGADNRTYEEFRDTLYEYGLQTCLDIYQAAYDRYLER